ncbi:hypothetical protein RND81_14G105200 [Saponaria officinalis]|uniref:Uncharacterized protein n=1 Tax=Saponaria officinalis TaxID=3572 RepID=A0AAW1GQQ0_SAPOF
MDHDLWNILSAHMFKDYTSNLETMSDSGINNTQVNHRNKWRRIMGMSKFTTNKMRKRIWQQKTLNGNKRKALSEPERIEGEALEDDADSRVGKLPQTRYFQGLQRKRHCRQDIGECSKQGTSADFMMEFRDEPVPRGVQAVEEEELAILTPSPLADGISGGVAGIDLTQSPPVE